MASNFPAVVSRRWMLIGVLLSLVAQSGCTSVEHIQAYRQARQDFSDAARADNLNALNRLSPDAAQIQAMSKSLGELKPSASPPLEAPEGMAQRHERWENVYIEFRALNSRAAKELESDQLLASSQTLETLAKARRDLYGHLLQIERPTTQPTTQSVSPLSDAVAEARSVLEKQKGKLFPRDAYLLRALEPLTRYEIAYVKARTAAHRGELDKTRRDFIDQLVGEMAKAETELEKVADESGDAKGSIMPHATMSRFMMLKGGEFLLQDRAELLLPTNRSDLKPGAIALGERIAVFRKRAMTAGTAEHDLFTRLSLEATPRNLTSWGVGPVIEEPATPP